MHMRAAMEPRFTVERLGVIMAPELGLAHEDEGVLNPAGATGPDGHFYLFPRLVAAGNYSRIGIARVRRDARGLPTGVERLGIALEPIAPYELVCTGRGGCEDPRVTYLPDAGVYVMTYTAVGRRGPRVALASSRDLLSWTRHGLVHFARERGSTFNTFMNKDAIVLPEPVRAPNGRDAIALLHRPIYGSPARRPAGVVDDRPSIWLSYCPVAAFTGWLNGGPRPHFRSHHLIAAPLAQWEADRIGAGTVPVRLPDGWLSFYHGVTVGADGKRCYQAGAMLHDLRDPRLILARSAEPLFGPHTPDERIGIIPNVVFPTAVDVRNGGFDVYYGMADYRIGVAHLRSAVPNEAMEDVA